MVQYDSLRGRWAVWGPLENVSPLPKGMKKNYCQGCWARLWCLADKAPVHLLDLISRRIYQFFFFLTGHVVFPFYPTRDTWSFYVDSAHGTPKSYATKTLGKTRARPCGGGHVFFYIQQSHARYPHDIDPAQVVTVGKHFNRYWFVMLEQNMVHPISPLPEVPVLEQDH